VGEKFKSSDVKEKIKLFQEQIRDLKEKEKSQFLLSTIKDQKIPPPVRAAALDALSRSSLQEETLFKEYANHSSRIMANAAKKALKELKQTQTKNKRLADLVLRKIKSTKEKEKKLKIIKSIAGVDGAWVNEVLLEALDDPSEKIRDFIIKELARREDLKLDRMYQKLLHPPWYVKSAVLKILAMKKILFL